MLLIKIANHDGSDPIVLEQAENRHYRKSINSADEGISFSIAKNSPKADVLNPDTTGYLKRWEVWDTDTNRRLNFGPISEIGEQGTYWKVTGDGRSAYLKDFYKTEKTFYTPIVTLMDDVRYENHAAQPRTVTLVPDVTPSSAQTTVFGSSVNIDEKYHGLSKKTKDLAIDDDTGLLKPGEIEPRNTFYTTDSFWSGMSRSDTHITDLGGIYAVNKINLVLPAWGGETRYYDRAYTYRISFATDEGSTTNVQDRDFGPFTTLYASANPNTKTGGKILWVGYVNGVLTVDDEYQYMQPIYARYIRVEILNTHAWYGTVFDDEPSADAWTYQCDPDYVTGSIASRGSRPAIMEKEINTRNLEAANDCHASISEIQVMENIIGRSVIKDLGLQRIDNNNFQITYTHTPDSSEIKTTDNGYRHFEPGSFFRRFRVSWSGAGGNNYTKFYDSDCANCYPDAFNFGIVDQHNNLIYASDGGSGTTTVVAGTFTSSLTMRGSSAATILECDAWPAKLDQLSWGASYSFTEIAGDTAIVEFRGESFKWYATVPDGKTGANVTMSIRSKSGTTWSGWSTLATLKLPDNIHNEVVYSIPYESGYFASDTSYQIRITNNDGNFCSIDSFEGYWSASLVEYNEDSLRVRQANPENIKQIYDKRYSNGSMYKFFEPAFVSFGFTGDRVIVMSAKGRNHGKARLLLRDVTTNGDYDTGTSNHVFIPGGNPVDGSLQIDLDTGKRGTEITQYVFFDSNDYFPNGLPWGKYAVTFYLYHADLEEYTDSVFNVEFDSFVNRCKDCVDAQHLLYSSELVTVNKPVFFDGVFAHETIGLSVSFDNEQHLEILKSATEAIQVEWDIEEAGLRVEPRLGRDTFTYLREGHNTLVDWNIVNDISQMATMLLSNGADIDGLPLFTITEDKETRARVGRTIMRQQDFRSLANYQQLIGLSRTELRRRAYPEKRMTVRYTGNVDLEAGDSYMLWTKKMGDIRVRIETKEIDETDGRTCILECVRWPQIV